MKVKLAIIINQAFMVTALQKYFEGMMGEKSPKVIKVEVNSQDSSLFDVVLDSSENPLPLPNLKEFA